jgi:hypothetical protein
MNGQSETRVFHYPNMVVRVTSPGLSEEENKRRMKELHKAAEALLKEVIRNEADKRKLL